MASSLLSLVNNLAEGINKNKCKYDTMNFAELNTDISTVFRNFTDDFIE